MAACAQPLRIGTSGDYPPFSMRTPTGGIGGFDVEVARAYASDRGRPLELVAFRWPELDARLAAGDFDVAMSGVTVRGDRLARFPMTPAVARAAAVLVVRAPDRRRRGPPARVAVNRGGHLERVARGAPALKGAEIRAVDDNTSLDELLARGEVDGVVTDTLELRSFGPGFEVAEVLARDRKAYWVRDDELAQDLGDWLVAREADGTLPRLRAELLDPSAAPTLPAGDARSVDLVARRLALMPFVAAAKRARGLPVDAPAREAEIEQRLLASARAAGLAESPYLELVRAQIDAAKSIQRRVLAEPADATPPAFDLETELRPAIDRIDLDLQRELARSAPLAASESALLEALRSDAPIPGLGDEDLRRLARALSQQRAER